MPYSPAAARPYSRLVKTVRDTLAGGLIETRRALEYHRLKTYWRVGDDILKAASDPLHPVRPGKPLFERMSRDLSKNGMDVSADIIRRSVQFRNAYPEFPENSPLTFTHYLALMRVSDPRKRLRLERLASASGLSSYAIKSRVLEMNGPAPVPDRTDTPILKAERGEPYVYLARPLGDLEGKEVMCVDCGFKIHLPFSGIILKEKPRFTPGSYRTVQVTKNGGDYSVRLAPRKTGGIHTYAARVLRVVDGDTLDALIDAGFGIRVNERFRLKGIDAPEAVTPAGRNAKRFLSDLLKRCPVIVVRTHKAGMYGRWLGDIFAKPGCRDPRAIAAEGEYLNRRMLEEGMAKLYR